MCAVLIITIQHPNICQLKYKHHIVVVKIAISNFHIFPEKLNLSNKIKNGAIDDLRFFLLNQMAAGGDDLQFGIRQVFFQLVG